MSNLSDLPVVTLDYARSHNLVAGGQVLKFPALGFTPLRTFVGLEGDIRNRIESTLAYSYPQHPHEPPLGDKAGLSGSIDSPFDFVWKMKRQQSLLAAKIESRGQETSVQENPNRWAHTTTPTRDWMTYLHPRGGVQAFVPNLGLQIGFISSNSDAANINDGTPASISFWSLTNTFEAGTDCVGFVQRAASYRYNPYAWVELPPGIMEAGTTANMQVLAGYGASTNRIYPIEENRSNYGTTIVGRIRMIANADGTGLVPSNAAMPSIEDLRKVLPGDIWVKDSMSDPETNPDDHIAIIASVPTDSTITDPLEYMDGMILIEGGFTGKIQSTIKKLSVGMYNASDLGLVPEGTKIYSSYSVPSGGIKPGIGLNSKAWAIRRLK